MIVALLYKHIVIFISCRHAVSINWPIQMKCIQIVWITLMYVCWAIYLRVAYHERYNYRNSAPIAPSTSAAATANSNLNAENNNPNDNNSLSRRSSWKSLLDSIDGRQYPVSQIQIVSSLFILPKFNIFCVYVYTRWSRLHQQLQAECRLVKSYLIYDATHRSTATTIL